MNALIAALLLATAGQDDEQCLLVFHSSNDEHALVKLKQIETA